MTIEEYLAQVKKFLYGLMKLSQETGIGIAFGREGAANELIHHWKQARMADQDRTYQVIVGPVSCSWLASRRRLGLFPGPLREPLGRPN